MAGIFRLVIAVTLGYFTAQYLGYFLYLIISSLSPAFEDSKRLYTGMFILSLPITCGFWWRVIQAYRRAFYRTPALKTLILITDENRWLRMRALDAFMIAALCSTFVWAGQGRLPDTIAGSGYLALSAAIVLAAMLYYPLRLPLLRGLAFITAPLRRAYQLALQGRGGSSRFARLLDEMPFLYKPGAIYLGRSLYGRHELGFNDDRHLLTIAGSRGGKGISYIIPNLLTWPGSALVIDPKGTNACVTANKRGLGGGSVPAHNAMGQDVYIIAPFGKVKGHTTSHYNPLEDMDPDSPTIVEDIKTLTEAIIIPSGTHEDHWDASASILIKGLIAHVLTHPDYAGRQHLGTVLDVLMTDGKGLLALFTAMLENPAAGHLAQNGAAHILTAKGEGERGSMLTTTRRHLEWLNSPPVREVISRSDFSLLDLKRKKLTVYLVLPIEYLENHPRLLRLFVNMAFDAIAKVPNKPGQHQCLFVLDEFYFLGTIPRLAKSAGLMAGMGMKLWPIIQNLDQLGDLYPYNWQAFTTGCTQVFSINDQQTLAWVVHKLGTHRTQDENNPEIKVLAQLRDSPEAEFMLSRETGRQLIFPPGGHALQLRRVPYFKRFKKTDYDPDPDYEEDLTLNEQDMHTHIPPPPWRPEERGPGEQGEENGEDRQDTQPQGTEPVDSGPGHDLPENIIDFKDEINKRKPKAEKDPLSP